MYIHFDRAGRYIGRSQRLGFGGCLFTIVTAPFVLVLGLLPFLWPFAVFGSGLPGILLTGMWNLLLLIVFVFVLGRPPRKRV